MDASATPIIDGPFKPASPDAHIGRRTPEWFAALLRRLFRTAAEDPTAAMARLALRRATDLAPAAGALTQSDWRSVDLAARRLALASACDAAAAHPEAATAVAYVGAFISLAQVAQPTVAAWAMLETEAMRIARKLDAEAARAAMDAAEAESAGPWRPRATDADAHAHRLARAADAARAARRCASRSHAWRGDDAILEAARAAGDPEEEPRLLLGVLAVIEDLAARPRRSTVRRRRH